MNSNAALFCKQCRRECLIQGRQIRLLINSCLFFLMILIIFPLTMRPEAHLMRSIAPGLVWMGVLLTLLLSAERLFQQDYEQGVIEQWLVSQESMPIKISAKVITHCFFNLLPVLLLSPLIALLFSLDTKETFIMALSLFCGTPAMFFLCAMAAAFGLGINQRGALMALILLPLTLPILIFGSGAIHIALQGLPVSAYIALLTAMSVLATGLLPYAIAAVIRIGHSE